MRIFTFRQVATPLSLFLAITVIGCDDDPTDESMGPDCPTTAEEPAGIFLTWQGDPTTTMTIDWHVDVDEHDGGDDFTPRTSICLRPSGQDHWDAEFEADPLSVLDYDRNVFRTELIDLEPASEYVFQVGDYEREFRFRTMPEDIDDEPLVFATGGDTMHMPQLFEPTNEAVMDYDPEFIVWGGDLAYADGGTDPAAAQRWGMWFNSIFDTLVDDDGRVVPILAGIGNHEVRHGYIHDYDNYEQSDHWRQDQAAFYYEFFAFPDQPGYDVIDFGDYLSFVALDSDHTNPVDGEQTEWLEDVLAERHDRGVDHVFPVYHVPAYPSHREYDGLINTRIRDHWIPLFEEYDLELVFENHDHTYKRTHPIVDGEIDEDDGIVYIGDGAWGVITREGDSKHEWYIDEFASRKHGIIVTLEGPHRHAKAVDQHGDVFDEYGDLR